MIVLKILSWVLGAMAGTFLFMFTLLAGAALFNFWKDHND